MPEVLPVSGQMSSRRVLRTAFASQVKSLAASADFDMVAGTGHEAETRKADAEVQATKLGMDVKIPNWLPYTV